MTDLVTTCASIASGLDAVMKLAGSAINQRDHHKFLEIKSSLLQQVIEVQQLALQLQSENFRLERAHAALATEKQRLEAELGEAKEAASERAQYHLVQLESGTLVYAKKAGADSGSPGHYLCANCFDHGKRAILQNGTGAHRTHLYCPGCQNHYRR